MMSETHSKIQSRHLKRAAYLYVRHNSVWKIMAEYSFGM